MDDKEKTVQEIYNNLAKQCSRTEKCSYDIRQKISTAGLLNDEADVIIEQLKKEKFIDDERFAKSYVSDRFRFNKWGKVKMHHSLKLKGLPDDLIQKALNSLDETKYRLALLKTMKEKARTVKKKSKFEQMGMIIRFAQNRGFEPELIHRYLNEVVE